MQGTMPGARRRGRPRTAWIDNIKTWTGLPVEESVRMTEDRDKWRKQRFWRQCTIIIDLFYMTLIKVIY